jgi:flagellar basal-body rod modification protein FlgD
MSLKGEIVMAVVTESISSASLATSAQTAQASSKATAAAAAAVDYSQFLQLLVAEMKNQDPTNPAEPTEFISQLASFSAVEQQVRANAVLDALLAAQADDLIGKTVASADGAVSGVVVSVTITPGGSATASLSNGQKLPLGSGITVSA